MPGPYSKPTGVTIVGAGMDSDAMLLKKRSYKKSGVKDKMARKTMKPVLPVWQDRDVKKRGSKLGG